MPVIKCSLFILFVFFFLHSCDTIRLGSASLNIRKKSLTDKGAEMLKLGMNVNIPSARHNEDMIMSPKLEDVDSHFMKNDCLREANSGSEDCTHHAVKVKLVSTRTSKDSIRRPRQNSRKRVLHSSFFSYEDLMQTDYKPPHRKSPIHNK